MKLIAGLGNPGARYEATPHNLGFDVVGEVARRWGLPFREDARSRAEIAEGRVGRQPVMLVLPQTFMNRSGESLGVLLRQREWSGDDLLVVTDEVHLPIGRLRIRPSGSHGGHNGLRSIHERLGTGDYARLRVGIAPPWPIEDRVAFVLSKLPPLERNQLGEMIGLAADAVETWIESGATETAARFNGLRRFETAENGPD